MNERDEAMMLLGWIIGFLSAVGAYYLHGWLSP